MNIGDVVVHLKADSSDLEKGINRAENKTSRFGSGLGKLAGGVKVLAGGMAVAGAAAGVFGGMAVKAFNESEQASAQLNAVLKSTKGAAGVTRDAALDLAGALQKVTTFDDEAILGGENLLLTFTKIGKDIFPKATETMLDMSQALGQDVKASAVQLGKALQDPILGVTALRRVGVNFSKDQQEVIKNLVDTGQSAKAQKLILKELNTEFGGSAKAAGQTFGGQLTRAKNILGEFMEIAGKFIAEKLRPIVQGFLDWVSAAGGAEGAFNKIKNAIINFGNTIQGIWQWFTDLPKAFQLIISPIGFLIANFETVKRVIGQVANIIMTWFWPSIKALGQTIMNQLWPALKTMWESIVRIWQAMNPALITAVKVVGAIIGGLLVGAIWVLINALNFGVRAFAMIINIISRTIGWVANLINWFGNFVVASARAVGGVIRWFNELKNKISEIFGSAGTWLFDAGKQILTGLWDGMKAVWESIKGWVGGLGDVIKSLKGPIDKDKVMLLNEGRAVMQGFNRGLIEGFRDVRASLSGFNAELATTGIMNGSAALGGGMGAGTISNSNKTYINGPINIASDYDADAFFKMQSRDEFVTLKGLSKPS